MADKKRSVWAPVIPVPEEAPAAPTRHRERGDPLRIFPYHNADGAFLGYVCRFQTSSGDPLHLPLTWCQDQDGMRAWRWIQFPRFRPLFGLDLLAQRPDDLVLLVFDEHAAVWARELLPWFVTVSWPGGVRNIDEVDWSPLRGRSVFIWPTRTAARERQRRDIPGEGKEIERTRQPGWVAALKLEKILLGYGCAVPSLIDPWSDASLPAGFDAGMAGLRDWSPDQATEWVTSHMTSGEGLEVYRRQRAARDGVASEPISTPTDAGAGPAEGAWIPGLISKRGELSSCLANVASILSHQEDWRGVIAVDRFSLKVVKLRPPPYEHGEAGEWTDFDDTMTTVRLQRQFGITPPSSVIHEAVLAIAETNAFHSVMDWAKTLVWDGVDRLEHWAVDFLGAEDTEYIRLASKWWLMGAAKRAARPGCKFDYVLVLEGPQGRKKSTVFDVLGGEWFGDSELDFGNKDSMLALQGKLIFEIQELGALARADERRQKAFLSRKVDDFRPPFGRGFVKVRRQLVFGGTTNEWEWNKDPTGGRRFWPVPVGESIDIDGLRAVRDQLFAEAFHRVSADERCWPTEEEQRRLFDPEQLKIEQPDAFVDALHDWVYARTALFSLAEAAFDGLKLDASKLTRDTQTRIGMALRKLGCSRVEKRNGMTRFWYKPPTRNEARSDTGRPGYGQEAADVGF